MQLHSGSAKITGGFPGIPLRRSPETVIHKLEMGTNTGVVTDKGVTKPIAHNYVPRFNYVPGWRVQQATCFYFHTVTSTSLILKCQNSLVACVKH